MPSITGEINRSVRLGCSLLYISCGGCRLGFARFHFLSEKPPRRFQRKVAFTSLSSDTDSAIYPCRNSHCDIRYVSSIWKSDTILFKYKALDCTFQYNMKVKHICEYISLLKRKCQNIRVTFHFVLQIGFYITCFF